MQRATEALVIRTAGTNCDAELCRALEMAGARVDLVHLHALLARPERILASDIIAFPGGFSYGDDVASGRVMAMHVRERLYAHLIRAIDDGAHVLGVCNGFQVLVQVGLLPGPEMGEPWPDRPPTAGVALTENAGGRFIDAWTPMIVNGASPCAWTAGLGDVPAELMMFPSAHGEGRLVASAQTLERIERENLAALRYGEEFNGSAHAIAGLCDASGRVFGLMPHPERYLEWNRHPYWTRLTRGQRRGATPGARIFLSVVQSHCVGA